MALKETLGKPDLSLIPLTFYQGLVVDNLSIDDPNDSPLDLITTINDIRARKCDDFENLRNRLISMYMFHHYTEDSLYHGFSDLVIEVAKVMESGTKKYPRENWALGGSVTKLLTACERHILNWGYDAIDKESGQSHIAHALCNICFLMYYQSKPDIWKTYDDRTSIYI